MVSSAQLVTVTGGPVTVVVTVAVTDVGTVLVTVGVGTVVVTVVVSVAVTVIVDGGAAAVVVTGLDVTGAELETVGVVIAVEVAGAGVVGPEVVGGVVSGNGTAVRPGSTISAAAESASRIPSAARNVAGWRYQGRRPVGRGVRASKSGMKAGVASARARTSRRTADMSGVTGIGLRANAGVASASVLARSTPSSGGAMPAAGMTSALAAGRDAEGDSRVRRAGGAWVPAAASREKWERRARVVSDTAGADRDSWEPEMQRASQARSGPAQVPGWLGLSTCSRRRFARPF